MHADSSALEVLCQRTLLQSKRRWPCAETTAFGKIIIKFDGCALYAVKSLVFRLGNMQLETHAEELSQHIAQLRCLSVHSEVAILLSFSRC